MAYHHSEVQRVLEEKQQLQKKFIDRSCRSLEPLKPGDSMRVRQGGTWEPAMHLGKSKVVKELYIHKVGFLSAIPDRNRIR